jgi:hypothetical protein
LSFPPSAGKPSAKTSSRRRSPQIESELRFSRDRVVADVQDAVSAVRAAYESLAVVRNEVLTARQLEEAERAKFDLGDSTQFLVNLRELATADAQFREIKAQSDYFKAFAEYDGSTTRIFSRYALSRPRLPAALLAAAAAAPFSLSAALKPRLRPALSRLLLPRRSPKGQPQI